jgi:predicted RNA binding protein YcfA (HicA-like mRNA interferase family)
MGGRIYPRLRSILLENGCVFVRQGKGCHEIWENPFFGKRFTVPMNIVSRNLANAILKQARIKQSI